MPVLRASSRRVGRYNALYKSTPVYITDGSDGPGPERRGVVPTATLLLMLFQNYIIKIEFGVVMLFYAIINR